MSKRKRLNTTPPDRQEDWDSETSTTSGIPAAQKRVRWENGSGEQDTEPDEASEKEFESEFSKKTCVAAFCVHRMGCAYYNPADRKLYVLEDTQETPHFDLTQMLLEQVDPDIVLTSSKADDGFKDKLDDYMEKKSGVFQIRPFKEFMASKGRDRLLSLSRLSTLATDDDVLPPSSDIDSSSNSSSRRNAYDFMRSRREVVGDPTARRWNASIRLANFASVDSSPFCLASIGALLDHVIREGALADLDNEGIGSLDIRDISVLSLNQVMHINADALISLQVFENESHASVHSEKTKEGLSLFGMLNNTQTTLGKCLLKTWLLRPSMSLSVIQARHDAIECFTWSENIVTANAMHQHLKGFRNVPRIMSQMRSGKAKLSDWQGLVKFTFHATMLRDSLSELHRASNIEMAKSLAAALDVQTFKEIGIMINEIIDWEESTCNDRVCVRPNIDEDLDNRKHVYHGIDSVLSNVAQQISQTVPRDFARSLNVVYFPQLGFLICVPMLDEWRTEAGVQPLEGWTFQFFSDDHVYFKSSEMHDMDTHVGDLHSTIVDRELEIIQDLLEEVLKSDETIASACDICAELDVLLAFAVVTRLHKFSRPEMTEDNYIDIVQGRHPLYEQVVDTFVANDARLLGGAGIGGSAHPPDDVNQWNSILLCTGANACGKSVYMKQIAVIQILAQIGCFVPAESATLGIVDKIFTRVSTRESVSRVQSAFMIDLAQVSLALRNCTARSLLLFDEFGKGTLSTGSLLSFLTANSLFVDGAGLFCGVLRHLLNRGSGCPMVLVATHFHDVFDEEILDPESIPVSFCHMQVMFTSKSGTTAEPSASEQSPTAASASPVSAMDDPTKDTVAGRLEKMTYLYRVAEGRCLDSYAAKCAEIFGIPRRIVERAQYVNRLLSTHDLGRLLDEEMIEKERDDLEDAEAVCRRFLAWDLKADEDNVGQGEVKRKLAAVLGRQDEENTE